MFGRWLKSARELVIPDDAREIAFRVREQLPEADEETVRVVAALAGLLAAVAYADRNYSSAEEALVRNVLGRVHGMTPTGVEAVCGAVRRHVVEASTVQIPHLTRELRELGDAELRREVLDALVDLAAADGDIATSETNLLRQIASSLGLTQHDYNESQARHRERLASLKG
jgi:uncharacterized tellurite resistance protein B-like protein